MKSNVLLWCKPVYKDHVSKLPKWYEKFILLNQVGAVKLKLYIVPNITDVIITNVDLIQANSAACSHGGLYIGI